MRLQRRLRQRLRGCACWLRRLRMPSAHAVGIIARMWGPLRAILNCVAAASTISTARESSDAMPKQSQSSAQIMAGARVTLHFSLALADGSIVDSNYDGEPATFVVGDGNLLPGFEDVLGGKRAGDSVSVRLPPDQAFGEHNADNVQRFPRHRFAGLLANTTEPAQPGTVVAFTDP